MFVYGKENFTDKHDLAAQKYGANWEPVIYGWADDETDLYPVTFQEGESGFQFEGHTLIADEFVPEEDFAAPKNITTTIMVKILIQIKRGKWKVE